MHLASLVHYGFDPCLWLCRVNLQFLVSDEKTLRKVSYCVWGCSYQITFDQFSQKGFTDPSKKNYHPTSVKMTIYLFGVLRRFKHSTGRITMSNWEGRGNQYKQFVKVLYCKLPTKSKQLPAFPLEVRSGTEP